MKFVKTYKDITYTVQISESERKAILKMLISTKKTITHIGYEQFYILNGERFSSRLVDDLYEDLLDLKNR